MGGGKVLSRAAFNYYRLKKRGKIRDCLESPFASSNW
jgi:hypothetical protein